MRLPVPPARRPADQYHWCLIEAQVREHRTQNNRGQNPKALPLDCLPGAPNGVSIEKPGPKFIRTVTPPKLGPGPGKCPGYPEPVEGPGRQF